MLLSDEVKVSSFIRNVVNLMPMPMFALLAMVVPVLEMIFSTVTCFAAFSMLRMGVNRIPINVDTLRTIDPRKVVMSLFIAPVLLVLSVLLLQS